MTLTVRTFALAVALVCFVVAAVIPGAPGWRWLAGGLAFLAVAELTT